MNNQNKFFDDLPIFQEHENELVEFESTWNLEKYLSHDLIDNN